jgi:hypothetical protein
VNLVGIHEATHTVLDPEDVVVDRVDGILEVIRLTDDASRVDAGEVERPRGLEPGRVEAEGERVEGRVRLGVGGVEVGGGGRVVGVDELEIGHVGAVDLELDTVGRRVDTARGDVTGREEFHGVVKVELLGTTEGRKGLLDLGDQDRTGLTGEKLTLFGVEVDVVGVALDAANGAVDVGVGLPADAELDIVVLESHEGESGLPVLTEGESERIKLGSGGPVVETAGDGLGETGREEVGGDLVSEEGVLVIDDLATDEELDLVDHGRPIEGLTGVGGVVDRGEVGVPEEVTLTLEANGGHATLGESTLNDLTLDSLGEVRVTLVRRPEKADFGLTDEVHILSTDSDELGDTTRHFIIYGEFIFKWEREQSTSLIGTSGEATRDDDLQSVRHFVRSVFESIMTRQIISLLCN